MNPHIHNVSLGKIICNKGYEVWGLGPSSTACFVFEAFYPSVKHIYCEGFRTFFDDIT